MYLDICGWKFGRVRRWSLALLAGLASLLLLSAKMYDSLFSHQRHVLISKSAAQVVSKVFASTRREDRISLALNEAERNRLAAMKHVPIDRIDRRWCANGSHDFTGTEKENYSQPVSYDQYNSKSIPFLVRNGREYRLFLIVIFNLEVDYESMTFIQGLYEDFFAKIVFYSRLGNAKAGIRKSPYIASGYGQHITVAQAIMEHSGYDGYWWIGDDVLLNYPYLFATMDFNKVWTTRREKVKGRVFPSPGQKFADNKWIHWRYSIPLVQKMYHCLRPVYILRMQVAFNCTHCVVYMGSDVGYIPSRFTESFLELAFVFRRVMHEITFPTILRLMVPDVEEDLYEDGDNHIYTWAGETFADVVKRWTVKSSFAHPVKFSKRSGGYQNRRLFALQKLAKASHLYRRTLPQGIPAS